jgi:hypothetical protein
MLSSVLENVLGGIPGNILGVYLNAAWELTWYHSHAGWECVIEWNWKHTWDCTWVCT